MDEKDSGESHQHETERNEAERIAHEWTSTLLEQILVDPAGGQEPAAAALARPTIELGRAAPSVDLSDVRAEVVRYGGQLRSITALGLAVPCLVTPRARAPLPVDLAVAANAEMPTAPGAMDEWLAEAREGIVQLADLSPALSYTEVPALQVMAALRAGTVGFVTTRILASWSPGIKKTTLYPVRVHTTAADLRVHYSLNISWHPVYFGAPSPVVSGMLPAGRFQFGVDGPSMAIRQDSAVFDIPQTQDAYLSVA